MTKPLALLSGLAGLALVAPAPACFAKSAPPRVAAMHSDFDLSRAAEGQAALRRYRLGSDPDPSRFPAEDLGPHWSYSPAQGGPTLELAALGGGRKGTPALAHVGVDWNF